MAPIKGLAMPFTIQTHDSWGTVCVGTFQQLEEAQAAFRSLCDDPWYRQDGGVKGLELVENGAGGPRRLEWFALR